MATVLQNLDIKVNASNALSSNQNLLVPARAMALKAETREAVTLTDVVQVPLFTKGADGTEYNETTNNYETDNGETHTFVPVTIDKHYLKTFSIKAHEWARLTPADIAKMGENCMNGLLTGYMKDMMSLITAANFAGVGFTGAASLFDAEDLVDARRVLVSQTGQTQGINAVLQGAYFDAILKDTQISSVDAFGSSDPAHMARFATGVRGISEMFETEIIPGNAQNLEGFISTGNGIAMANVVVPPPADFGEMLDFTTVTEPTTGLTVAASVQMNTKTRAALVSYEFWGGHAKGNGSDLVRILSA